MGGILSSLNTSYTGLQSHQLMVDVTGNNIANASDEFYSRQRVVVRPERPLYYTDYNLGRGVSTETIARINDEFVFSRYRRANEEAEYFDTHFDFLREASAYFPEVDGVGIYNDLEQYFNSWKDIAKNAKDPAQKQVLAQNTQTLTKNIQDTRRRLEIIQKKASDELASMVDEINGHAKEIAQINAKIIEFEDHLEFKEANELRDRRDELEFALQSLIGADVFKSHIATDYRIDRQKASFDNAYTLNVAGGFNMVDGTIFRPLIIKGDDNALGLNQVYYQSDDWKHVNITDLLSRGKAGSLIDLYNNGQAGTKVGKIQDYINRLDTFAQGLIEATNGIYAQSAHTEVTSQKLKIMKNKALMETDYNVKRGSFDVVVYNTAGAEIARKNIVVNEVVTLDDIVRQINANTDDTKDNNAQNDVDDFFVAHYDNEGREFSIRAKHPSQGLRISIQDHGTNLPGTFGMNRFFSGNSARNIELSHEYIRDSSTIRPWLTPVPGNYDVANMMQQLQYDEVDFFPNRHEIHRMRLSEYFQNVTGRVATQTEDTLRTKETKEAVLSAIKKEHLAISQVSVDEEMVNLIKFQGGYAANAKVITTIDRMIETLLGIKQ